MSTKVTKSTEKRTVDFIRSMVALDVASGKHGGRVVTRFPPEPNGYLHIGHAKSICLNFGLAREFEGGTCHLRFDDTNPEKEDASYAEAIQRDIKWLGFDWHDKLFYASDYYDQLFQFAVELVEHGKAYVCSLSETEIREYRGTVTEAGRNSPYRDRGVEENLDLFHRMRAGDFPNGAHVLRAKIDMAAPNMIMRDPLLYRIRHAHHYRTGDAWCIYPMYDFAHPLGDAIECVTHSLCSLEFKDNRELYDWVVDNTSVQCRPEQTEFARLNLDNTVLSKRKLIQLVKGGHVSGWDDPRMPTIAGLRRRGVSPESVRAFCDMIGVARVDSRVDIGKLEYAIRDDLNMRVPRVMAVLNPVRLVVENYDPSVVEELDAPYYPHDVPKEGSRSVPFTRELLVEREDFAEHPPKGFHRLSPGREVRLRYAYLVTCTGVSHDPKTGEVVEIRCTYDPETRGGNAPDGRVVNGTIHWVSAKHALPAEVRLYDRLFEVADPDDVPADGSFMDHLNPRSLVVVPEAWVEPSVAHDGHARYQFERLGYFARDPDGEAENRLVFNRTVTMRDTWAKKEKSFAKAPARTKSADKSPSAKNDGRRRRTKKKTTAVLSDASLRYVDEFGLTASDAETLATAPDLATLFEDTLQVHRDPVSVANWLVNDVARELKRTSERRLTGAKLAGLIALVDEGTITKAVAKTVLVEMITEGGEAKTIVEDRGLRQVSDSAALLPLIQRITQEFPDKVSAYRDGREGLLGFFVGAVMKETGGTANPEVVKALLKEQL